MKKNILMALLLVLFFCGCSGKKEEAYRIIQVLEVSGSVSVERQSMGTMDAYEGMQLQSGDRISVGTDSWLKIKMDEDKYALVEPESTLRLEASGNGSDSKTVLHLEIGAVSNHLEQSLSDASSYEVSTPNSTMAVRGTVFRVEVTIDESGISVTDISVYDGSVSSRLVYPDGTVDAENKAVLIVDGTSAQVWGNETHSSYVTTDASLDLDGMNMKVLEFLQEACESGMDLAISSEELEELIAALEQEPQPETTEAAEATTAPTEETTAPTTPKPTTPPAATTPPSSQAPTTEPTEESTEATTEATEFPGHTVTFRHNGSVFATQTVASGETAAVPKLQPTASGSWNFDFSTAIIQNTDILWSANG